MTYTLWSHNELLGESALDYVRVFPDLRTGDLYPTPKGLTIIGRLTQTRADIYYGTRCLLKEAKDACGESEKTLHADLAAQVDQNESAAFELRTPDGSVIPTESIHVTDTDYLLTIGREAEAEDESLDDVALEDVLDPAALAEFENQRAEFEADHPPWAQEGPAREPARFQISVRLTNQWSIP